MSVWAPQSRALDEGVGGDVELALVDPGRRLAPRRGIELALPVVDEDRGLGLEVLLGEAGGGLGGGLDGGALGEELGGAEEEGGRALAVAQEPLARVHAGDEGARDEGHEEVDGEEDPVLEER